MQNIVHEYHGGWLLFSVEVGLGVESKRCCCPIQVTASYLWTIPSSSNSLVSRWLELLLSQHRAAASSTPLQPQHVLQTTTALLLLAARDQRSLTTGIHLTARAASSLRGRERKSHIPPVPLFHPRSRRPLICYTDICATITSRTHSTATTSDRAA